MINGVYWILTAYIDGNKTDAKKENIEIPLCISYEVY